MKPLRPQLRGLIFKLTLFYVLLSLPCLVLVETGILVFEFNEFMAGIENGALAQATSDSARNLARTWPREVDATQHLATWAEALVLRLQRPYGGLLKNGSYILSELSTEPLTAAVLDPDGQLLAAAPANAPASLRVPRQDSPEWHQLMSEPLLAVADSPYRIRRAMAPIRDHNGPLHGYLLVELSLPVPWHRFLLNTSLDWPIVLGYLLMFGVASSFFLATWVTRRLNRVTRAASAWSRGDFSDRIADPSRDELGNLSAQLDEMALELKDLMGSRAQLATLAERQRLARDLHDTVKQKAFALSLQLATARRQLGEHPAGERVAQAETLGQQIQQELAQILDELRASDGAMPFVARLRARAQEWAQLSGQQLHMQLADLPALPRPHEEALLRIVDEALGNVLRHSGASRVDLSLGRTADGAELAIVDNGRGTADAARPGMGLANMRERAESLPDGIFEFDSAAKSGTRIGVRFTITMSDHK
jgi:signal transduction histidine kinase